MVGFPSNRQAHNLKVVGSNPTPATNYYPTFPTKTKTYRYPLEIFRWFFYCLFSLLLNSIAKPIANIRQDYFILILAY